MLSVEGSEIAEQLGDMSHDENATLGKIDSLGYQLLSEMFEVNAHSYTSAVQFYCGAQAVGSLRG
jgi:hypothetical protein